MACRTRADGLAHLELSILVTEVMISLLRFASQKALEF